MGVYKISEQGDEDIEKMYEYGIETFGLKQAQDYFFQVHDLFQDLADNSHIGRDVSEYKPYLKRFNFKAHSIFYISTDTGVLIVRVLGKRMDFGQHL